MQNAVDMMDSWSDRINDIISIIDDYSSGKISTEQANMRQYNRFDPKPAKQSCSMSNHSITINNYNERSLVIRGNTRAISEKLKEFGAKFNGSLIGGPGWIISNRQESDFRRTFALYI